jgi:hypothetical protein
MKLYLFAAAVTATACAEKTETNEPFTAQEAASAGNSMAAGIEDAAKGFGPVNQNNADGCVTMSGDPSDADHDSIPANAKATYNCTARLLGYTGTVTGTQSITDDAPTIAAWAFTGSHDFHSTLTGPVGNSVVRDTRGSLVATQSGLTFGLQRMFDGTTVFTDNKGSTTVEEAVDWKIGFMPTVAFMAGQPVVAGALSANGSWDVAVGAHAANATIATPTPLTIAPSCASLVTAGSITASYDIDGTSHAITVTWTACGQHIVTSR